jgi:hypothetical protein
MVKKFLLSATAMIIAIAGIWTPCPAFCADIPQTPIDIEGTDTEYRELLGVWKGSWGKSDHIILIHKISGSKIYTTQARGEDGKSA